MDDQAYFNQNALIQKSFIEFIDYEDKEESQNSYQIFLSALNEEKVLGNRKKLRTFLNFVSDIIKNHHRSQIFFKKIIYMMKNISTSIQKHISNPELYNIFKENNTIIYLLTKEKMLKFDETVNKVMKQRHSTCYEFFNCNDDAADMKRAEGSNDSYLCSLIRSDSAAEFIQMLNMSNILPDSFVNSSAYETNSFLLKIRQPTLIEYATFYGSIQIFQYLQKQNVELTPLLWLCAIHSNSPELIHLLEDFGVEPEGGFEFCLKKAIKCFHNSVANYLIGTKFDKDITDKALFYAVKYGNYEMIEQLISVPGININAVTVIKKSKKTDEKSLLGLAVEKENLDLVRFLLSKPKIDPNVVNVHCEMSSHDSSTRKNIERTPLFIAVEKGNVELVELLLSNSKTDVNKYNINFNHKTSEEKRTALYFAVEKNRVEIVKLLLKRPDINVNSLNFSKAEKKYFNSFYRQVTDIKRKTKTALIAAIHSKNVEICKLLLANEAIDVNIKMDFSTNIDTKCPLRSISTLYLAIEMKSAEIVSLLLSAKDIDVNSCNTIDMFYKTISDNRPLHIAVKLNLVDIIKLLLKHKDIDINAKNSEHKSPVDIANTEIRKLLSPK